jgi:hypothetical protein
MATESKGTYEFMHPETARANGAGVPQPLTPIQHACQELSDLLTAKDAAYGSAFSQCGEFLRLLYPDGLRPEQYDDALCLVRIFDKAKRIATRKDAYGESPYQDLAGYAVLGLVKDREGKG